MCAEYEETVAHDCHPHQYSFLVQFLATRRAMRGTNLPSTERQVWSSTHSPQLTIAMVHVWYGSNGLQKS